jgi:uncharacterized protein YndB with AHSA1/START domain
MVARFTEEAAVEIRREVLLPVRREEVWAALTDADRLAEWFANEVRLDVEEGGEGIFRWSDGEVRRAVVECVEPDRSFSFRWSDEDAADEEATTVAFTLEDAPEGTLLTVVESAPALEASAARAGEWVWAIQLWAYLLWEVGRLAFA